jgi:hypothetical protein
MSFRFNQCSELDTLEEKKSKSGKNQKLTDSQIATIKYLREEGYSTIVIARLAKQMYGIGLSTTYYHCQTIDPDWGAKKKIQRTILMFINQGYTTGELAKKWNIPLAVLNKLYVG